MSHRIIAIFEEISDIPRVSGNEIMISNYIINFAKSHGLEYYVDEHRNVLINKCSSIGYENCPTILLQGHVDMVGVSTHHHNFYKDSLILKREGNLLSASGTTLGADNGVAISYMLAILEDNTIQHPNLECLFTTGEEIGMRGALNFDTQIIKSKYCIGLDSLNENEICVGNAGCSSYIFDRRLSYSEEKIADHTYCIEISNLPGGHSGGSLTLDYLNAIELMSEFILYLHYLEVDFSVCELQSKSESGTIPNSAFSIISTSVSYEILNNIIRKWFHYEENKNMKIKIEELNNHYSKSNNMIEVIEALSVIDSIRLGCVKFGVKNNDIPRLSANINQLTLSGGTIKCSYAIRYHDKNEKDFLEHKIKKLMKNNNFKIMNITDYPPLTYYRESSFERYVKEIYKESFGKEPIMKVVHGGMEVGIWQKQIQNITCLSIGPNMWDIHTPRETLDIDSFKRIYDVLLEILKNIKKMREE